VEGARLAVIPPFGDCLSRLVVPLFCGGGTDKQGCCADEVETVKNGTTQLMVDEGKQPARSREELLAWARAYRRAERDAAVRAGRRKPRTVREFELWRVGLHERLGIPDNALDIDEGDQRA
jgi:hypothetical protein